MAGTIVSHCQKILHRTRNFFRLAGHRLLGKNRAISYQLRFGTHDLVYGPSAGGRLRELAQSAGGRTLNDLPKPLELNWIEFSLRVLEEAAESGTMVRFDLTYVEDLPGVLAGRGIFASTVTTVELRYIQANWERFRSIMRFYDKGREVPAPWEM
ncbi:hypothetical protein HYR99_30660 [Candidatus Poribacteria bacterium]|nr:hypothetical protein [Candidatus Poribacteria bacterium]